MRPKLKDQGRGEDDIAYLRDCREYRNFLINELPNGDFAFTMARQLMIDAFDVGFYKGLTQSADEMLAAIAAKAIKESRYHLRRSEDWIKRLGDGTDESHERTQNAFDQLWGYAAEMFEMASDEQQLVDAGIAVDRGALKAEWTSTMHSVLKQATLDIPARIGPLVADVKAFIPSTWAILLAELQYLQRTYPGQQW